MGRLLRRALKALFRPFGILSWVLLLLAILIWFIGPWIAIADGQPLASASVRLAIILILALAWGITGLVLRVRRQAEEQALLDAARREQDERKAAAQRARADADARVAQFVQNARGALRLLGGRRRLNPFSRRRDRFPRYLVIGSKDSGKTALLDNAGLVFHADSQPAADDDPARFLVTEQGLFIEIAPAYLRQSAAYERAVWQRMLGFIRRQRSRQPANGIILTLNAGHLNAMEPEQAEAESRLLRRRLDDIGQCFRSRPPVYIILTQLDRLAGFEEYFAALDAEERNAAFGVPLDSSGAQTALAHGFGVSFENLVGRLKERQLRYLHAEADAKLRRRAFGFPVRFALLESRLTALLGELSAPSHFATSPNLRGVFFTSALQTGPADDRLSSALAARFALKPDTSAATTGTAAARSRPFFLRGLFRHALLAEPAGEGHASHHTAQRSRLRAGAFGILAGIAALACVLLWWRGYSAGGDYTTRIADEVTTASIRLDAIAEHDVGDPGLMPVIDALDNLAALTANTPAHWTFGLFSSAPVRLAGQQAYARGLKALLLPQAIQYLHTHLAAPTLDALTRFDLLGYYLTLAGDAPTTSAATQAGTLDLSAGMLSTAAADGAPRLARHLSALAALDLPNQPLDESLADSARTRLARAGLARIAYQRLTAAAASQSLAPWRPIEHAGAAGSQAFTRVSKTSLSAGIPGLYTRAGYRSFVVPASQRIARQIAAEAWVMGDQPAAVSSRHRSTRIRNDILALYGVDTMRHWDRLLADLTFIPTADAEQAARLVALIGNKPSPATTLLTAIAEATRFRPDDTLLLQTGAADAKPASVAASAVARTAHNITEHYAALATAVGVGQAPDGKAPQQTQLDALLAALQPLYKQLNQLAAGADPLALDDKLREALAGLNRAGRDLPSLLQPLFDKLGVQMATVTGTDIENRLAQMWNTTVLPKCQALVDGHYPFDPGSPAGAPLTRFAAVFGPKGVIASFRENALESYIDTSVKPWRWRADDNSGLALDSKLLASLERAHEITKAYFDASGAPGVQLQIKPLGIEGPASAFQLDIGGSVHTYAYGSPTPMAVSWPAPPDAAKTSLSVSPVVADQRNAIVYSGPWALFRLLDTGNRDDPAATVDGGASLRFPLGRRLVRLQVRSVAGHDFIGNPLLRGYTCPRLQPRTKTATGPRS